MRKNPLNAATLACVEPASNAIRVLEKQALHPQWRENDAWKTADQGGETIRQAFLDVRFVSHNTFHSAYRERRRQEATVLPPDSHNYRVSLSWETRRTQGECGVMQQRRI